jgi:hypothetical protein
MSYVQKQEMLTQCATEQKKTPFYIHPIYRDIPLMLPVSVYIPLSFNRNYAFTEKEKYDIHSLLAHAYETRKSFRDYIDTHIDPVCDTVRIITGFHESFVEGCRVTHFNIAVADHIMHINLENSFKEKYIRSITMLVTM